MTIQVISNEVKADTPAAKPTETVQSKATTEATSSAPAAETHAEQNEPETSETSGIEAKEGEIGSEGDVTEPKEGEETDPKDASDKPKKKSGFQRRVDKLNARIADKERETEYWKEQALKGASQSKPEVKVESAKPAASDDKPNPDKFDTHAEYVEALTDWKVETKQKERDQKLEKDRLLSEQQKQVGTYQSRAKEFSATTQDYDDVMADVADVRLSPAIQDILLSSDNGPELAYEMAKDPKEFARLCNLPPAQAYREVGKFEARIASKDPKQIETKRTTSAPKPIAPVGGKGVAMEKSINDPGLSQREFEAIRRKQLAARKAAW